MFSFKIHEEENDQTHESEHSNNMLRQVDSPDYYIVQAGDTLRAIAQKTCTTVDQLAQWNKIDDVDKIRVNQSLLITEPKVPIINNPSTGVAPAPTDTVSVSKPIQIPIIKQNAAVKDSTGQSPQVPVIQTTKDKQDTKPVVPATATQSANTSVVINYSSNIDHSTIKASTEDYIRQLGAAMGVSTITINSTARTPLRQAEVMYDDPTPDTYAAAGTQVQALMYKMKKEHKSRKETTEAMRDLIIKLGPENVSNHCADQSKVNTVDISLSSIPKGKFKTLLAEANKLRGAGAVKEIQYPAVDGVMGNNQNENAFHISFYVQKGGDGTSSSASKSKVTQTEKKPTDTKVKDSKSAKSSSPKEQSSGTHTTTHHTDTRSAPPASKSLWDEGVELAKDVWHWATGNNEHKPANQSKEAQTNTGTQPGAPSVSGKGKAYIKAWEQGPYGGAAFMPYDDGYGYMTIGWGHKIQRGENFNKGIDQAQADALFEKDLKRKSLDIIQNSVKVKLSQQQLDALASYVYNTGEIGPKCLAYLNKGDFANAVKEMDIVKAAGEVSPGLQTRRKEEHDIFNKGVYARSIGSSSKAPSPVSNTKGKTNKSQTTSAGNKSLWDQGVDLWHRITGGDEHKSNGNQKSDGTPQDSKSLAKQIVAGGNVTFDTLHSAPLAGFDKDDDANAIDNINATAQGKAARTSPYAQNAVKSKDVFLNEKMLLIMFGLSKKYKFTISEISGGRHQSDKSAHYSGRAFDVSIINGQNVSPQHITFRTFSKDAISFGATTVLNPDNEPKYHSNHVHIQVEN